MTTSYTRTAIALHWLVAAMLIGAACVGLYMVDLPLSPQKLKIYSWHKWAGVTIFLLVVIRLAWRHAHPAPGLPSTMPAWQRHAAGSLHLLLYVLMFGIPLSGWLMSSAAGFQTVWFGVLPLPDLLPKDKALAEWLKYVHRLLNYTLFACFILHVAAALKHHLIDRDDILSRMLPFLKRT